MENSPPEIHIIPSGALAGGSILLGIVVEKSGAFEAVAAFGSAGGTIAELAGRVEPTAEAVVDHSFQMEIPAIARRTTRAKIHCNTLRLLEPAAVSLWIFGIKSPELRLRMIILLQVTVGRQRFERHPQRPIRSEAVKLHELTVGSRDRLSATKGSPSANSSSWIRGAQRQADLRSSR